MTGTVFICTEIGENFTVQAFCRCYGGYDMARKKMDNGQQRQDWKPHWSLEMVYKIWMVVFTTIKVFAGAFAVHIAFAQLPAVSRFAHLHQFFQTTEIGFVVSLFGGGFCPVDQLGAVVGLWLFRAAKCRKIQFGQRHLI